MARGDGSGPITGGIEYFGAAVSLALGTGIGLAAAFESSFFQTNFFPLFTHRYWIPEDFKVTPSFVHVAPAFTVTEVAVGTLSTTIENSMRAERVLRIIK